MTGNRNRLPAIASTSVRDSGGGHATALPPLNRIVVRDLGVHPRGEFRTSEWPSDPNAEDLSEQRGWAPKTLRRYVRARRGVSW